MTARDPLAEELAALSKARRDPRSPEALATLGRVIERSKYAAAIASAADIVAEAALAELAPGLPAAFERFVAGGASVDPSCRAKIAVVTALARLEFDDADFYLRGIKLVQRDPVYGGNVDTSAEVRGQCALALSASYDARAIAAITDLLVDIEWVARLHAARALGASGRPEVELVLRYKALAGDPEPQVETEVFAALLSIAPRACLPFVAGFLDERMSRSASSIAGGAMHQISSGDSTRAQSCTCCGNPRLGDSDSLQDAAALALGQSKRPEALPLLLAHTEKSRGEQLRVALLAIALLRSPDAITHLIALIEKAPLDIATHALAGLAIHRYDDALRSRVLQAAKKRGKSMYASFKELFG